MLPESILCWVWRASGWWLEFSVVNASAPCNYSFTFSPFDVMDWQTACCNKILPQAAWLLPKNAEPVWNGWICFLSTYALAVTPKMSPQVRSCPIHADSGFLWACFESIRFAELIVHERQVQATIHFCPFPEGRTCPTNMFELFLSSADSCWRASAIEVWQLVQPSNQFKDQRKRRWLRD